MSLVTCHHGWPASLIQAVRLVEVKGDYMYPSNSATASQFLDTTSFPSELPFHMSPGFIDDDQQVVAPQKSPDALVAHSTFLEPYVHAASTGEDQPVELTPSTTTATLPTPEAAHIQFTGIERHNPPRFIFYPISWDEPDNLLMAAEVDQPLGDLNTSFGQLAIRHDDLSDPLSAVLCTEDDPFDSIDHWRQNVVNCNNPWYGGFESVSFLDECGRSHDAPSEMRDSELNLSRITDRKLRIKARPKSLPP